MMNDMLRLRGAVIGAVAVLAGATLIKVSADAETRALHVSRPVDPLAALGDVPPRGVAVQTSDGVQLVALDGRVLATLKGVDLAPNWRAGLRVAVVDRRERRYELAVRRGAFVRAKEPPAEQPEDWLDLPPPNPNGGGHWRWALRAPSGDVTLAQWSGECETRHAYFLVPGADPQPVVEAVGEGPPPETVALGWSPDGRALVAALGDFGCGDHVSGPGVYFMGVDRRPKMLAPGTDAQMWSTPQAQ